MGNKKVDLESLKRLKELERQLREYTEEDYLREAEEMEREMAKQEVNFEPPEGFFEQVLAKGKLLEAEKRRQEKSPSDQKAERKNETRSVVSGSAKAAAIMKLGEEKRKEETDLQENPTQSGGLAGLPDEGVEKEKLQGAGQQGVALQEIGQQGIELQEIGQREVELQEKGQQEIALQETGQREVEKGETVQQERTQGLKPLAFRPEEEYGKRVEIDENGYSKDRVGEKEKIEEEAKPEVLQSEGQGAGNKKRRGKLRWRLLLALGVLVACMVFGVSSGGKGYFLFKQKERENVSGQHVVLNNGDYMDGVDEEVEAYYFIEQEIGIDALRLGDRPYGLVFEGVELVENSAYLYFKSQEGDYVLLKEAIYSYNVLVDVTNDGERVTTVYNEWLDIAVDIYEEEIKDDSYKYNAVLSVDSVYYVVTGYMDLDSYISIIADLNF